MTLHFLFFVFSYFKDVKSKRALNTTQINIPDLKKKQLILHYLKKQKLKPEGEKQLNSNRGFHC